MKLMFIGEISLPINSAIAVNKAPPAHNRLCAGGVGLPWRYSDTSRFSPSICWIGAISCVTSSTPRYSPFSSRTAK